MRIAGRNVASSVDFGAFKVAQAQGFTEVCLAQKFGLSRATVVRWKKVCERPAGNRRLRVVYTAAGEAFVSACCGSGFGSGFIWRRGCLDGLLCGSRRTFSNRLRRYRALHRPPAQERKCALPVRPCHFEADWGFIPRGPGVAGSWAILAVVHVASKMTFFDVFESRSMVNFILGLRRAFRALGIPKTLSFDQDRAHVAARSDVAPVVHASIERFCRTCRVTPVPCRPYRPWEKPHVERQVGSVKRYLAGQGFRALQELRAVVLDYWRNVVPNLVHCRRHVLRRRVWSDGEGPELMDRLKARQRWMERGR